MTGPHILILGGTGEARRLAERLVALGEATVTLSLAGRTAEPRSQAGNLRSGGFGGAAGLASYLHDNKVDLLVDATHPFATRISTNAIAASEATEVPLIVLERRAWQIVPGDRWTEVADVADAGAARGDAPLTVFLAIGRQELAPFRAAPQHRYIVRSVDPVAPESQLAGAHYILERGPFDENSERHLLTTHGIETIVAKNSGGDATYGKIAAARALGIPVVMIRRQREPFPGAAETIEDAIAQIRHAAGLGKARGE
ncbi:MAG: cobalt-precorrin-6A reductase [Dongiaceae bacterium]